MMMEKRNVVENKRTPDDELNREDEDWDKAAAAMMCPLTDAQKKKEESSDPEDD